MSSFAPRILEQYYNVRELLQLENFSNSHPVSKSSILNIILNINSHYENEFENIQLLNQNYEIYV